MKYNEKLANRIRESLLDFKKIEEKQMFGGLAFMLNGKMSVGVIKDEMICRIDPDLYETVLEKRGCREMDFTGRPMKGWIMISAEGMISKKDFDYWITLAVEYNKVAAASKKKK